MCPRRGSFGNPDLKNGQQTCLVILRHKASGLASPSAIPERDDNGTSQETKAKIGARGLPHVQTAQAARHAR
jgi:hypothetical protein